MTIETDALVIGAGVIGLTTALQGAEVLEHRVGLRPARPEVRLELGQIEGTRVVHNYGHGALGVTLAWGCAAEAASLLTGERHSSSI